MYYIEDHEWMAVFNSEASTNQHTQKTVTKPVKVDITYEKQLYHCRVWSGPCLIILLWLENKGTQFIVFFFFLMKIQIMQTLFVTNELCKPLSSWFVYLSEQQYLFSSWQFCVSLNQLFSPQPCFCKPTKAGWCHFSQWSLQLRY